MKALHSLSLTFWVPVFILGTFVALWTVMAFEVRDKLESDLLTSSLRFVTYDMTALHRELESEFAVENFQHAEQALSTRGVNVRYQTLVAADENGQILYSTHFDQKGQQVEDALSKITAERVAQLKRDNIVDIHVDPSRQWIMAYLPWDLERSPDEIRASRTGGLFAIYDLEADHKLIWDKVWQSSYPIWLLMLGAMSLLILFLRIFVTRPIQHLVSVAHSIEVGDSNGLSRIGGSGELARLGQAFNEMHDQLQQRSVATRESEEKFSKAFYGHPIPMEIADMGTGSRKEVNDAFCKMLGYSREELIGTNLYKVNIWKSAEEVRQVVDLIMGNGLVENHPSQLVKKNGEIVDTLLTATTLEVCGENWGIGSFVDITERRRVECALEESEMQSNSILENAVEGIITIDGKGLIRSFNRAAEKLFGYTAAEAIGRNVMLLMPSPYREEHDGYLEAFQTTGIRKIIGIGREVVGKRKDGSMFPMELGVSEYTLGDRKIFTGILRNITERKQNEAEKRLLEAQLVQSQKLESVGTLASGVAHEINNPINGIMNYAQLIVDRLDSKDPLGGYAGEIISESQRIATIVSNLLVFSRQENEPFELARISDIIERSLSLNRFVMSRDQIEIELSIPDDLPDLKCRSQKIQQVFMNLLNNARDALNERYPEYDENKKIRVSASQMEKEKRVWIRLTVEDHGSGISEKTKLRIFDPFFTTKDRTKGTGLGLSISHGIMQEHKGTLSVESEPGQPTRFHLDIPCSDCEISNI